jgi:peptidoglycan hydrolase CwlO-like protein
MGKMNLKLAESLESNYIPAIKKFENDKDLNEELFALVLYLMRHTSELSSSILSDCDKPGRRDIFSSFGEIAQIACNFYQTSKEHLDPVALSGGIGRQLEAATQEITKVKVSLESLKKNEEDLLKKEDDLLKKRNELSEKNDNYEKLKKLVSKLKEIEERVTIEALNKLTHDLEELKLHLGENSNIAIKLKEYGISSVDRFVNEIDNIKKSVKENLANFDKIIKGVIEELEKEREDIGRRNKTLT